MSEPLSKLEIEDVLSSIRRLVSDDLRPSPRVQAPKPESDPAAAFASTPDSVPASMPVADKLLLTPALRVVRPAAPEGVPELPPEEGAGPTKLGAGLPEAPSDSAAEQAVAVPLAQDSPLSSDVVCVTPSDPPADGLLVLRASAAKPGQETTPPVSDMADAEWEGMIDATDDWPASGWSDDLANSDDLIMEFVHRPRNHDAVATGEAGFGPAASVMEDADFADIEDVAPASVAAPAAVPEDLVPEAENLGDDDPGSDTAISGGAIRGRARVVPQPMTAMAAETFDSVWADQAEAAVLADLEQDIEDGLAMGTGPGFAAEAGEVVFDEAVLRDLVRDLIREELAGSLGERITRNVRKLVRAEIARALAVRELG